jgi:hypothetical protein
MPEVKRQRNFKLEDSIWKQLEDKAELLSRQYGLHITVSDLIREGIKKILEDK